MPPSLKKPSHDWNPRISVFTLWPASHFFPSLKKKKKKEKAATKVRPLSHALSNQEVDERQSWKTNRAGRAPRGGRPPGWAGKHVGITHLLVPSAWRREATSSHSTGDVLCCHFRKKENPEQIWRGFHHRVIAVLFKGVTVTPPTERNSDGN